MTIIKTPQAAIKNEDFTKSLTNSYKSELSLTGIDIYSVTNSGGFNNTSIELKEMFIYSLYADVIINDGDIIKDSEGNEYTAFVYNKQLVSDSEYFEVHIKGTVAYLYTF